MAQTLRPDQHQQEERAAQAKKLADQITSRLSDREPVAKVTFKGEAIEISAGGKEIVVTANGDATFSIKDGPHHASFDDVLKYLTRNVGA